MYHRRKKGLGRRPFILMGLLLIAAALIIFLNTEKPSEFKLVEVHNQPTPVAQGISSTPAAAPATTAPEASPTQVLSTVPANSPPAPLSHDRQPSATTEAATTMIAGSTTAATARPKPSIKPPAPLKPGEVSLVLLKSGAAPANLLERLAGLEPVQNGYFAPLDYLNGKDERLLALVRQADLAVFSGSGLEYKQLDADGDPAHYYAIRLPDDAPPKGETWLDPEWQVLDQVGNRYIVKAPLPMYVGLGFRSKLKVDKLPPRLHLEGVTAACPCADLAAATFAAPPPLPAPGSKTATTADIMEQIGQVKEENLQRVVAQIASNEVRGKPLNTRYTGTAGSVYAAERIFTYFFALGLPVEYDSFLETALGTIATNVIAEQPGQKKEGTEPVLLIGHYDSLGIRNLNGTSDPKLPAYGANDNGVGIAGLMETARLLAPYRFKEPIRYIAFGAEEQVMLGSQHYATYHVRPNKLKAVINIDSFGYNPGQEDWVILAYDRFGAKLKNDALALAGKYKINLRLDVRNGEAFYRSDDHYFDEYGYETITFTDSFQLQSPNNHTPHDTVENVNFTTTRKVIQLALVTIAERAGLS